MKQLEPKQKQTLDTIKVRPFHKDLLIKLIAKAVPLKEKQEYNIDIMALHMDEDENLLVDTECCYMFLEDIFIDGEVQKCYLIPVRYWTPDDKGNKTMRMDGPDFYYPLSKKYFDAYTHEATTLKEYQGSRHDYNPRIKKNQIDFLKLINR